MAFDAFLKIAGINGNAPDGSIELYSFSFGASNTTTVGGASGGGAGKVSFSDLNITKKLDKSSADLFQKAVGGNNNLGIMFLKIVSGNEAFTYMITEAAISMYKLGDGSTFHKLAEGCADGSVTSEGPVESISFNFADISPSGGTTPS